MNGMRILGVVCAGILASSLGTLAACGGAPDAASEVPTSKVVSQASVSIALMDGSGNRIGEGSGVMIAPRLVLTSGHLVAGKSKWVVTAADGKTKVSASRAMTYDWRQYDSDKAHPRKHDVGVIYLDADVVLAAYPKIASSLAPVGAKATRIRGTGAGFATIDSTLDRVRSTPSSYLVAPTGETLDTGGALYDERGILGVVSGRGNTTGKIYIARVDKLARWLAPKIACAGGALGVRAYAPPAASKAEEICEDGGTAATSSSSSSSGGGGASGDGPGQCAKDDSDGVDGPTGTGAPSTPASPSPSGGSSSGSSSAQNPGGNGPGSESPNGDGPNPGGGAGTTPGASSGTNGSANPGGSDGNPSSSGGGAVPGAPGAPGVPAGTSGSSGNSGTTPGAVGSSGSSGAGSSGGSTIPNGSGDEPGACQGSHDNPETCPIEETACVGPTCGGGQPDDTIDFGFCACKGVAVSSTLLR